MRREQATPWEITRDGDIVRIEFLASPSRQDMLDLMDALDTLENSELRMYVMQQAEMLLSTADVRVGAEVARALTNQPRRIAVVAPGEISYGISRIFKVYRESEDTQFEVFREEAEAKAWLLG
jgi:hypothetical protein